MDVTFEFEFEFEPEHGSPACPAPPPAGCDTVTVTHSPIHIEHEGRTVECHVIEGISVQHVLCHDFLLCPHSGTCHLVVREESGDVLTLWDCDANGHVYHKGARVRVARPDRVRGDRSWPLGFGVPEEDEERALEAKQ